MSTLSAAAATLNGRAVSYLRMEWKGFGALYKETFFSLKNELIPMRALGKKKINSVLFVASFSRLRFS